MRHLVAVALILLTSSPSLACEMATGPQTRLARPTSGEFRAGFGLRRHPLLAIDRMHEGADFAGPVGMPVVAAASGIVQGAQREGEYGLMITLDHGGGIVTRYAHLSRIGVEAGSCVSAGQEIGALGNTGLSTEPHLHFEVHQQGRPVDPMSLMRPPERG